MILKKRNYLLSGIKMKCFLIFGTNFFKRLRHYIYNGEYYSISDPEIFHRKFLKNKKILLLDRDGTINVKAKKTEY